jgi:hypothetical protein
METMNYMQGKSEDEVRRDLEAYDQLKRKVKALTFKALDTLGDVMDSRNPKEARQAAETVLDRVGFVKRDEAPPPERQFSLELRRGVVNAPRVSKHRWFRTARDRKDYPGKGIPF